VPSRRWWRQGPAAVPRKGAVPRGTDYQVLGVQETATDAEIRDAFLRRAAEVHPDHNSSASAADLLPGVLQAYRTLSDAEARHVYDQQLSQFRADAGATRRAQDEMESRMAQQLAVEAVRDDRCAHTESSAIWDVACLNPPSHQRGSLLFCSAHAPRESTRLVPVPPGRRAYMVARYVLSLVEAGAVLAIITFRAASRARARGRRSPETARPDRRPGGGSR